MSNAEIVIERDRKNGRFLPGNAGNGGRKPGQRNKLGEAFIADLRDVWEQHGAEALKRCAVEEPAQFIRCVASLLPKDIRLDVSVDAASFAERFRSAYAMLGNEPPARLPKAAKVIDAR